MKTTIALFYAAIMLFTTIQSRAEIIAGPITNPANGHDYFLISPNTWVMSEAEAESLGGTLAIIRNADEQKWVFNTFGSFDGANHTGIWIGLHRTKPGGSFVWVTGMKLEYIDWSKGEPNNVGGVENCAHMNSEDTTAPGAWNDLPDNNFNDRKYGVVELSVKADEKTLSKEERALVGNWYEGGQLEQPCWIAGTDNMLFVIPRNRFAARVSLCDDGSLLVFNFQNGWPADRRVFNGFSPMVPRANSQTVIRGEIVKDKILWSDGT
jgi:hypothetical protein